MLAPPVPTAELPERHAANKEDGRESVHGNRNINENNALSAALSAWLKITCQRRVNQWRFITLDKQRHCEGKLCQDGINDTPRKKEQLKHRHPFMMIITHCSA